MFEIFRQFDSLTFWRVKGIILTQASENICSCPNKTFSLLIYCYLENISWVFEWGIPPEVWFFASAN